MRSGLCGLLITAVLAGCASVSPAGLERAVRADLAARGWPATSVLMIERGRPVLAMGHRLAGGHSAVDAVYPLGSVSKMFTAAAVHRLAEQGVLDLEAPVARYLAEWPVAWQAVQVHQLLSHTSGVPDFWFVPEAARLAADASAQSDDILRVMSLRSLDFAPGTQWSYSNTGFQAAARLIERLTDGPYERFLEREFFAPLGLASMHHCLGTSPEMPGHVRRAGRLVGEPPENYATARGDGGLCGSARDLARWMEALGRGDVLRPSSLERLVAAQRLPEGSVVPYGHGISLRRLGTQAKWGHHGAMAGHSAMTAWYPAQALAVVVLTSVGGVPADAVEQRAAATHLGLAAPPAPASAPVPDAHLGRFDLVGFRIEVQRREGQAWLAATPPVPQGRLMRMATDHYALDGDPWGVLLQFDCAAGGCNAVRLHMAGMEWPGRRVPPAR